MVEIGDRIKIISENENYDEYRDKIWIVEDIATSIEDHPGYDATVGGDLISCEDLPDSLYEYEFEEVIELKSIKSAKACRNEGGLWVSKKKKCYG